MAGPVSSTKWWFEYSHINSLEKYRHAYDSKNCDDIFALQSEIKSMSVDIQNIKERISM